MNCIASARVEMAIVHLLQRDGRTLCGVKLAAGQEDIGPASCERCLGIWRNAEARRAAGERREKIYNTDL